MSKDLWTKEQMGSIRKMLYPKSIAVIGASERNRYGERFLNAALRSKDRVRVYPINPNHQEMMGVPCFASVSELPEAPDVVALLIPQSTVLETLKACHEKGAGAAIVLSGGFAERGTEAGRDLQREMGRIGRETGMRICGPNCLGVANVKDNIWSTATSKNPSGLTGHIGLVCQSGATAYGPFVAQAADNGFGFSHIISSGNETDLEFSDYVRFLLDDADTQVIGGFVEGFRDVRKLIAVAELAAERGKPIVLVKIGRSESGARAAVSHTASLTGSDAAYDAIFKQYGIIRVYDYAELLQVSNYLVHSKKPKQRGVAVVSNSGGISSLTADSLGNAGLNLPSLTEKAQSGISGILKNAGWAANPADVTGFANSDLFPQIMDFLIEEPEVGTLIIASQALANRVRQVEQVISLHQRSNKNVSYLWIASRRDEGGLAILKNANVPIFYAPEDLARTLTKVGDYEEWQRNRIAAAPALPPLSATQKDVVGWLSSAKEAALSESDSKKVLAAWGVPAPAEILSTSAQAAAAAAEKLGFPVVLKLDSPDVVHKTEADVVRLGLRSAGDVARAYEDIMANAGRHAPKAKINGVMVQEMVAGGVEVIAGVSYDPQIGPMLLFGIGGVMVEIYNDVALRRCPIDSVEAMNMISEVQGAKLLHGFRGSAPADIEALADTLVRISHLAVHLNGRLDELDINPLVVLPKGQGVKALDALAVFKK